MAHYFTKYYFLVQAARPTVTVYDASTGAAAGSVALPAVFTAPIRKDVVQFVHTNIRKNSRQAYAVYKHAGEQTSAMSWGTGRAVARIPRVGGSGTGRAAQGAFGNMCRKGRMFSPTKIWRRWHRKVSVAQRRYAIASALAASAVPALVQARGHKVENVSEIPLVISNVAGIVKTKQAVTLLQKIGAYADVERVIASKKVRAGKGKARNRRFVQRRGPLVIYGEEPTTLARAFRNIPGVDLVHVDRLNLLQLAPGGHVGRFVIWTNTAFEHLNKLFSKDLKAKFVFPRAEMANADLARLINSSEIQSVIRPAVVNRRLARQKKNPLTNKKLMNKLNPYAAVIRKQETEKKSVKATRTSAAAKKLSKAIFKTITSDEFHVPQDFLA